MGYSIFTMSLSDKNIILGVSGGIAAYKAADLCRRLKRAGANVRVVMTAGACEFVQPLTFQALSGEPVSVHLLDESAEAGMGHIELAKWADIILVAPATANLIARLAKGFADDLLSTLVLATEAQLILAPAMNQVMWANPVTQNNLSELSALYGARLIFVGPDSGDQACGDVGLGRMVEPQTIIETIDTLSAEREAKASFKCRVVITAGPTREAIDPVRYITNHSSGKMGFALAEAFRAEGAQVTLITGPVSLTAHPDIVRVDVETAQQMHQAALMSERQGFDIFVGAAAVADYAPIAFSDKKMKKNDANLVIELQENPDIIAAIGDCDNSTRLIVGFAAETNDVVEYAKSKRIKKKLDLVIANDVSDSSIGFNSDENQVTLVSETKVESLNKNTKHEIAKQLAATMLAKLEHKRSK